MTTTKRSRSASPEPQAVGIPKTYKLYIGGKFPRSESGRSFPVGEGSSQVNVSWGSRKDVRDAVVAARAAFAGWAGATAYNRGQVLYRVAEILDGRRAQFVDELVACGARSKDATAEVDDAIAWWIHYAGFSDKIAPIVGGANTVAAPYFNFSVPEPTGVVALIAPGSRPLADLAATLAPIIVSGNTSVVIAAESNPMVAISFAEVLATSDVPSGVVNIITGHCGELAPVLAAHMDVNAIDLAGVSEDMTTPLEQDAVENLKRVARRRPLDSATVDSASLEAIERFLEIKTVWHPIGT